MALFVSALIAVMGIVLGGLYLLLTARRRAPASEQGPLDGVRPWRRLGAAICVVLSAMFVPGAYLIDERRHPRVFLLFWAIMFALLVWLCLLALKDVLYTRRLLTEWRRRRGGTSARTGFDDEKDDR